MSQISRHPTIHKKTLGLFALCLLLAACATKSGSKADFTSTYDWYLEDLVDRNSYGHVKSWVTEEGLTDLVTACNEAGKPERRAPTLRMLWNLLLCKSLQPIDVALKPEQRRDTHST